MSTTRWVALAFTGLTACSSAGLTPKRSVSDPSVRASAPSTSVQGTRPREQDAAPAAERVSVVPAGMLGYEALFGPDVVEARAPSAEHPDGTVLAVVYRSKYEGDAGRVDAPYAYEWDLARGEVVRSYVGAFGPELVSLPRIDSQGDRVAVLTPRLDLQRDASWSTLEILDHELRRVRSKRLSRGDDAVWGSRGEIVVSSRLPADAAGVVRHELELFDATLRRTAHTRVRLTQGDLEQQRLLHAGDSFYLPVATENHAVVVLRLDDRTLRERARSEPVQSAENEPMASLDRAGDHWVLMVGERGFRLDADLRGQALGRLAGLERPVWNGVRPLGRTGVAPGSSVERTCTPLWAFGAPLFGCAAVDQVTMVRPVLQQRWSPFEPVP